jgi:hypothetical protein
MNRNLTLKKDSYNKEKSWVAFTLSFAQKKIYML